MLVGAERENLKKMMPEMVGCQNFKNVNDAFEQAHKMLGKTLVTNKLGIGKTVNKVYVELGCSIVKEFYLALLVDRSSSSVSFVCSKGGMDIEKVAEENPLTL